MVNPADRDIPEEMVERGAQSLLTGNGAIHEVRVNDEQMARWISEQVLSAAAAREARRLAAGSGSGEG